MCEITPFHSVDWRRFAEDELVSLDELQEKIAEFEDYVQSTDIAAMQSMYFLFILIGSYWLSFRALSPTLCPPMACAQLACDNELYWQTKEVVHVNPSIKL